MMSPCIHPGQKADIPKHGFPCLQIPLSCIAVLGAERQQILSASGVASSQPYTDRKVSFCAWLLVPEQPELLIVEDMMADSR